MHGLAHRLGQPWSWGFLDNLLVAALQGAVPIPEHHHIPLAVTQNLHLDVACLIHKALYEQSCVAEVGLRLLGDAGKGAGKSCFVFTALHADASAPGAALEDDGVARFLPKLKGLSPVVQHT